MIVHLFWHVYVHLTEQHSSRRAAFWSWLPLRMRKETIQPSASILVESMRDIGYTFDAAIADLIDNSIAAGAKTIDIFGQPTGNSYAIGIVDDGHGMTESELFAAMRFGSRDPRSARAQKDLGRFGLGLKTATFSQCRRFTVISRTNAETSAAIWDLDTVRQQNEWKYSFRTALTICPGSTNSVTRVR